MSLTGIQILKLLPKTNCGECGVPTCLAFAMNLATGKAELDSCPYVSKESREQLSEASAPPIRQFTIGSGEKELKVGGETVLFRHEKTFFNPCGFAGTINDTDSNIIEKVNKWSKLKWERVGLTLYPELAFIKCKSNDPVKFESAIKAVVDNSNLSIMLSCEDTKILGTVAQKFKDKKPLLCSVTQSNISEMIDIANNTLCPLVIKSSDNFDISTTIELVKQLNDAGCKDLVIDSTDSNLSNLLQNQVVIRRSALLNQNKLLGYPTICFTNALTSNINEQTIIAAMLVAKYSSIIVLDDLTAESIFPLLLERLNIYTDPQRPMMVTEGIYGIGNPGADSPIAVTTNFSLTYFIVSGEIEASRVPTWLSIIDTEGLSVMTAWAAGKFAGDLVGQFIKKSTIVDDVNHHSIIIPGYASSIAGDLEEELPGWTISVGPREAAHLAKYLKEYKVK